MKPNISNTQPEVAADRAELGLALSRLSGIAYAVMASCETLSKDERAQVSHGLDTAYRALFRAWKRRGGKDEIQ